MRFMRLFKLGKTDSDGGHGRDGSSKRDSGTPGRESDRSSTDAPDLAATFWMVA